MMRSNVLFLLFLFAAVFSHPTEILDGSGFSDVEFSLTLNDDFLDDETRDAQRLEALAKLQQIFGIPESSERPSSHKIPPQFMMELYNTIADPSGITRGKNLYNAKIVRSFAEIDSSMSHHYLFNISDLEANESVLEAELHLYRKRTPFKAMHPAFLSSPYYLIRVYQVLDERQLDIPDLHKLLSVHYVGAHASGWQVFNVKQAVISWISGAPNLGLLVTASNLFGDDVAVHFYGRNNYRHSKQPILVLFNDDGKDSPAGENIILHDYKYANDLEDQEEDEAVTYNGQKIDIDDSESFEDEKFVREKHRKDQSVLREESSRTGANDYLQVRGRERRDASSSKKDRREVSRNLKISDALTSMDIYERAMIRRRLAKSRTVDRTGDVAPDSTSLVKRRRSRSTPEFSTPKSNATNQANATGCARHELYVDFKELGWSDWILAPEGYSAYQCKGHCKDPVHQVQPPSNHATVQSLVHMVRQGTDVNLPCCVPTKLLSISILYFLDDSSVVLKLYHDMRVDRCGCR